MADQFVQMLGILNTKIQEQAEEIEELGRVHVRLCLERNKAEDDSTRLSKELSASRRETSTALDDYKRAEQKLVAVLEADPSGMYLADARIIIRLAIEDPALFGKAVAFMKYEVPRRGTDVTSKLQYIKSVREMTHWGLKEGKEFVEEYLARHAVPSLPSLPSMVAAPLAPEASVEETAPTSSGTAFIAW